MLAFRLRRARVTVKMGLAERSLKVQFRRADKEKFDHVAVFEEDEKTSGLLTVCRLADGLKEHRFAEDLIKCLVAE